MKFKQIILSSIFWRGLYFVTVLLLNIILSRLFQAKGSGWIYYITNYFSFILLLGSLCLETGMAYFASKRTIREDKLATFSIVWSILVSFLIMMMLLVYYRNSQQAFTRNQFLFISYTYIPGVLFTTFFCALFYAQLDYALPNILLALTNSLIIIGSLLLFHFGKPGYSTGLFLKFYFINYLIQGVLLGIAYLRKNNLMGKWSLPNFPELKLLFRYSLMALTTNVIYFLLYRIDYWFVEKYCSAEDLGNYIQVSKLGQFFLVLPAIMASTIFPRTAAGFREEMNHTIQVLSRILFLTYLILLLALGIAGRWVFPMIYGYTFTHMVRPFLYLIPGVLSLSVLALLAAYNAGKDKISINVKGGVFSLLLIILGDVLFIPKYGIEAAAIISSAGYVFYLVYVLYIFQKEYKVSMSDFFLFRKTDWQNLKKLIYNFRNKQVSG